MTGPLYAFAEWWLGVLPVDDAGRRCCDETLADWRKEAEKASGSWAALVVSMRSMFALVRCLVGVSLREVVSIRHSGVPTRVLLWTVGYLVAVNAIVQLSPSGWKLSVWSRVYSQVALISFFFPIALLLATALGGRRRRLPALGLAVVALMSSVALIGWGSPLASRAFIDASFEIVTSGSGETRIIPKKPGYELATAMGSSKIEPYAPTLPLTNDLTVVGLARTIAGGPESDGWSAINWMSFFFAYLVGSALIPFFASVLKQRNSLVRYVIVAATAALLWTQGNLPPPFGNEFSIAWWLGAYWIPVIWMALCLIAVTRPWAGAAKATPYVTSNSK